MVFCNTWNTNTRQTLKNHTCVISSLFLKWISERKRFLLRRSYLNTCISSRSNRAWFIRKFQLNRFSVSFFTSVQMLTGYRQRLSWRLKKKKKKIVKSISLHDRQISSHLLVLFRQYWLGRSFPFAYPVFLVFCASGSAHIFCFLSPISTHVLFMKFSYRVIFFSFFKGQTMLSLLRVV